MKFSLPLKILLGVCVLALLTFVVLSQKGTPTPGTGDSAATTTATATDTAMEVTPSLSMEDAQKQLQDIQAQIAAGTLSPEEADKQIQALGAQVAPPPLPADAKK